MSVTSVKQSDISRKFSTFMSGTNVWNRDPLNNSASVMSIGDTCSTKVREISTYLVKVKGMVMVMEI